MTGLTTRATPAGVGGGANACGGVVEAEAELDGGVDADG
jgi:hypothetical protein